jgi:heterodisulfide reductase subunit A
VKIAAQNISLCTESGASLIKSKIKEYQLNRVVVAACTPKTHEPLFRTILKEAGVDSSYLEFVNIREQCTFVHTDEPEEALVKAKALIRAAVERVKLLESIPTKVVPVLQKALVVGGGVAGLQVALDLADKGMKVYIVEREPSIGGHMAKFNKTYPTDDCSI